MDCWRADDAKRVAVTVAKEVNKTLTDRRLAILANKRNDTSISGTFRDHNSDGFSRCIDLSIHKILWEDSVSRGLLKPRCVKTYVKERNDSE